MPPLPRSLRPTCPACAFPVFNRRYARCEKCGVALPDAIVYTAAELVALRAKELSDDEARERRKAKERGERARRGLGLATPDTPASLFGDALEFGGDLLDGD